MKKIICSTCGAQKDIALFRQNRLGRWFCTHCYKQWVEDYERARGLSSPELERRHQLTWWNRRVSECNRTKRS